MLEWFKYSETGEVRFITGIFGALFQAPLVTVDIDVGRQVVRFYTAAS